jgi:hypothetical protein
MEVVGGVDFVPRGGVCHGVTDYVTVNSMRLINTPFRALDLQYGA